MSLDLEINQRCTLKHNTYLSIWYCLSSIWHLTIISLQASIRLYESLKKTTSFSTRPNKDKAGIDVHELHTTKLSVWASQWICTWFGTLSFILAWVYCKYHLRLRHHLCYRLYNLFTQFYVFLKYSPKVRIEGVTHNKHLFSSFRT